MLGARVLNGADVFALELSKSAQATLLRTLGIDCPRSITFNDVRALREYVGSVRWPALLKPDQGGSGARMPFGCSGASCLDNATINLIRNWILQGAQNN